MSVDTDCVVIQIGNSDDKLTQKEWSQFVAKLSEILEAYCLPIHFSGTSFSGDPWQNACWVMELPLIERSNVAGDLEKLASEFRQDSIAVMIGRFEFFGPHGLIEAPLGLKSLKKLYNQVYQSFDQECVPSVFEGKGTPLLFVSAILDDFRRRIEADTTDGDPLKNRNLMIDPVHDSQVLGVPHFAVVDVVERLEDIGLLDIWGRATCPNTGETISEAPLTDDCYKFPVDDIANCHECGQDHLIDRQTEQFYVLRKAKRTNAET
ncbi:hypothetical protein Pan241w_10910 [Gimesia alba]|uniref:Uncharacterized protein n=1 Tax=Gimesia alba TaxID=2527973 RepID=A0A517RAW8_9PLAN|nr:hypothetical protein [Gimesia alba]QDT41032.1 hypothetical protein Pan241w_10910 [Gimesia alba]